MEEAVCIFSHGTAVTMKAARLFVLLAVAVLASAQSPEELEYQRKLADYEEKKAVYDRFQAVATLPVVASNDLVSKLPADQIPPGYAEQLLPTYTGKPVHFSNLGGPVVVPEPVAASAAAASAATTPVAVPVPRPNVAATPFRAKRPAASSVSLRAAAPMRLSQVQQVRGNRPAAPRPSNLIFFTSANLQLPSLGQRYAAQQTLPQWLATRARFGAPRS